jgi:hypothetical protein
VSESVLPSCAPSEKTGCGYPLEKLLPTLLTKRLGRETEGLVGEMSEIDFIGRESMEGALFRSWSEENSRRSKVEDATYACRGEVYKVTKRKER